MKPVSFTVYGVAQPAGSKRAFPHSKTGRVVVVDDAKQSRPWKQEVAAAAVQAMAYEDADETVVVYRRPLEGPLLVELTFWLPRPKSHYGSGRNSGVVRGSAPAFPTGRPDVLKLARAVEDAMSGIVYRDDAQIVTEVIQKAYGACGELARVVVRVVPVAHDTVLEAGG